MEPSLSRESTHRNDFRNISTQNPCLRVGVVLFALLLPLIQSGGQGFPPGYVNDNSDWWSSYAQNSQIASVKAQHRIPAASNFRILGITLGDSHSRDFPDVIAKLGEAVVTGRGDASTGRDQICYSSAQAPEQIHLIFEEGELEDSFYLFAGGPDWTGSDRCVSSKLISKGLSTASGLHLGQTRLQVEAILGNPSASDSGRLVYSCEVQQRTTPEEIKKIRQQNPNASEQEFIYFTHVSIEARFVHSKLNYLAVSKSEFD